ncbi:MAG: glycosyl hydrolase, partial [Candidatus Nephrothrix sp. EaCA]
MRGIQGNNPKYYKAAACAKHFAVHSGPEPLRHEFNAAVSASDLHNTYLPAFKKLVTEANVGGVMCAYNAFEKVPCCANAFLLQNILRKEWGFKGYIVTDCWAIADFYSGHKYVPSSEEAIALALKNTVNVECGQDFKNLKSAVAKKLIAEKEINAVLSANLEILFKLGWFDDPKLNPFNAVSETEADSEKNRKLARETAAKSIVLLSNKNQALPLKNDLKRIALVGPNADNADVLLANYNGLSGSLVTMYEGLVGGMSAGTYLDYAKGCNLYDTALTNFPPNLKSADVVIAVMGLSPLLEGENGEANLAGAGGDKKDIRFPQGQISYLKKLKAQIKSPLIVALTGGSAMELAEVEALADAVVLTWYPGEEGGNALADVLFGKVNPAGRLPLTFYKSNDDLPDFKNYEMKGRTYRYFSGVPQHPFGFGLSYTAFAYQNLKVEKFKDHVLVSFGIKNTGAMDGEEVPQLYIHHSGANSPIKELKAFRRLFIKQGETAAVTFKVPYSDIQFWEESKKEWTVFS